MDKLKKYKSVAATIVQDTAQDLKKAFPEMEIIPILDEAGGHFLLYEDGWQGAKRLYNCVFHIDITVNAKVCLRIDNTDFLIGKQLIDGGVNDDDFELGWIPPNRKVAMAESLQK